MKSEDFWVLERAAAYIYLAEPNDSLNCLDTMACHYGTRW